MDTKITYEKFKKEILELVEKGATYLEAIHQYMFKRKWNEKKVSEYVKGDIKKNLEKEAIEKKMLKDE